MCKIWFATLKHKKHTCCRALEKRLKFPWKNCVQHLFYLMHNSTTNHMCAGIKILKDSVAVHSRSPATIEPPLVPVKTHWKTILLQKAPVFVFPAGTSSTLLAQCFVRGHFICSSLGEARLYIYPPSTNHPGFKTDNFLAPRLFLPTNQASASLADDVSNYWQQNLKTGHCIWF